MSVEMDIVRDVSERLTRAEIPFMLTGSMAMNAYAELEVLDYLHSIQT